MRSTFITALILIAVSSARADAYWYSSPPRMGTSAATSAQIATRLSSLRPGQSAYTETFVNSDADSKVLDVTQCEFFTALYYRGGSQAKAYLMDNDGSKILNQSGDLPLTGLPAEGLSHILSISGIPGVWVDTTVDPASSLYGTMRITCATSE